MASRGRGEGGGVANWVAILLFVWGRCEIGGNFGYQITKTVKLPPKTCQSALTFLKSGSTTDHLPSRSVSVQFPPWGPTSAP